MNRTQYEGQKKAPRAANKYSIEKLQSSYVSILQSIAMTLCDIITQATNIETVLPQLQATIQQLKFHQKMKSEQNNNGISNIIHSLNHLCTNFNTTSHKINHLPLVKNNNYYGNFGSLATIAQKSSQQNLLSNYIRKSNYVRKLNNLTLMDNHSQAVKKSNYEYNREQTRRSLDASYGQIKKPLYSQLERINGKEILPPFYSYEEKKPKKSKLTQYKISKYI